MRYCQVYLRNIKGIFTWETDLPVERGSLVVVKFRNRNRTGVVIDISEKAPEFKTEKIVEIWEQQFFPASYITLAQRIADQNFCGIEKVLSLMIPEKFHRVKHPIEREVWYELVGELEKLEGLKGKKQKELVKKFQNCHPELVSGSNAVDEIPDQVRNDSKGQILESELREDFSMQTIKSLVEKGFLEKRVGSIKKREERREKREKELLPLTALQKTALGQIQKSTKPSLLFGVTGSGKTEVYKYLIDEVIKLPSYQATKDSETRTLGNSATSQILFLVPEIALTPQLIENLYGTFGDRVALWHSNLSEGEKIQEWARITSGEAQILVGTRSAVLIPIPNLKLIVMDEEHEWTYKNEFVPRFWTHDVVEQLAGIFDAKVVLGTATPRVESLNKCNKGNWELVELPERVFAQKMPNIQIVDLENETKKGNYSPISEKLEKALKKTLEQGRQAVLFLNKRGYAGSTMCRHCGHTFGCPHCDHPMKMHQNRTDQKFVCHVCGYLEAFPDQCSECHKTDFNFRGWGTQQVESHLQEILPQAKTLRADRDSVSGRYDFENVLRSFERHEADILLGTQMIAKGLDLEKVDLVGIVLADVGLNLPDFRSEERVFQLLMQVSGRAGRRERQGEILVQTYQPDAEIFQHIQNHDVSGFLAQQLQHRESSGFAPDQAILKITISHIKKEVAWMEGKKVYEMMKEKREERKKKEMEVFFAPAFFPRTHGKYHFHVIVKGVGDMSGDYFEGLQSKITLDSNPVSLL